MVSRGRLRGQVELAHHGVKETTRFKTCLARLCNDDKLKIEVCATNNRRVADSHLGKIEVCASNNRRKEGQGVHIAEPLIRAYPYRRGSRAEQSSPFVPIKWPLNGHSMAIWLIKSQSNGHEMLRHSTEI